MLNLNRKEDVRLIPVKTYGKVLPPELIPVSEETRSILYPLDKIPDHQRIDSQHEILVGECQVSCLRTQRNDPGQNNGSSDHSLTAR